MNNSLIAQVVSSLTMLAHKTSKDINSKTGEVENLFFYSDESKEEWIRLNFQTWNGKERVIIAWSRTVYLEDDTRSMVCSRELEDWSDYMTILTVFKSGICFT